MKPRMWIPNPRQVAASNFVRALFSAAVAEGRWRDIWPLLTVLYDLEDQADPPKRFQQLLRTPTVGPLQRRRQIEAWAEEEGAPVESEFMSLIMPSESRLHVWLQHHVRQISEFDHIYTNDLATLLVMAQGARIAAGVARERRQSPGTLPLPLVINGPTGAGKELLAIALHKLSKPGIVDGEFGPVNCGGLPSELIEAELFGHARGSFTGAVANRNGMIAAHAQGTVFLDEIGDTPPQVQVRLLRFLNDGEVRRVGADRPQRVSPWVIAATHRDLDQRAAGGAFREDLLHRLRGHVLSLPALASRQNDILPVLDKCIRQRADRPVELHLSVAAKQALLTYQWPGNLRELEQLAHGLTNSLADEGNMIVADLATLPEPIQQHYSKLNSADQIYWAYSERVQYGDADADLREGLLQTYAAGLRTGAFADLHPALLVERITASRFFAAVAGIDAAIKAQAVAEFRREAATTTLREHLETRLSELDGLPVQSRTTLGRGLPREDGLPPWIRHFLRLGEEASIATSQWGVAVRQLLTWIDELSPGARAAAEALFTSALEDLKNDARDTEAEPDRDGSPSHAWQVVRTSPVLLGRYFQRYGSAVAMAGAFRVNERTIRDALKKAGIRLPRGGARNARSTSRNRKSTGTRRRAA